MRESKQTEAQAPRAAAQSATIEVSDFEKLLQQEFKPKSEEANTAVQGAVNVLVEQALQNANLVSTDAIKTIEGMISELDKKLTAQVNEIMHHKDFLRSAQDSCVQYFQTRAGQNPQKVQGLVLGSKPDLQDDLRRRVWYRWW